MTETVDKVKFVFSSVLGVPDANLSDETSPDNTKEWDSLRAMHLVTMLEDTFGVQLSTREIMRMRTIGIVRDVLRTKGVAGV